MNERPAVYNVGNVAYVEFRKSHLLIDREPSEYFVNRSCDSGVDSSIPLLKMADQLYAKSRDQDAFSNADNLVSMIALMEPPMIGLMAPFFSADWWVSDESLFSGFYPPM